MERVHARPADAPLRARRGAAIANPWRNPGANRNFATQHQLRWRRSEACWGFQPSCMACARSSGALGCTVLCCACKLDLRRGEAVRGPPGAVQPAARRRRRPPQLNPAARRRPPLLSAASSAGCFREPRSRASSSGGALWAPATMCLRRELAWKRRRLWLQAAVARICQCRYSSRTLPTTARCCRCATGGSPSPPCRAV